MQISTVYNGTLITGVVVSRTPAFLEVAITSPFSKIRTSRRLPGSARGQIRYEGAALEFESSALLVELYEIANRSIGSTSN